LPNSFSFALFESFFEGIFSRSICYGWGVDKDGFGGCGLIKWEHVQIFCVPRPAQTIWPSPSLKLTFKVRVSADKFSLFFFLGPGNSHILTFLNAFKLSRWRGVLRPEGLHKQKLKKKAEKDG